MSLKENISRVISKVEDAALKYGRNPSDIEIVAVTKYSDIATTREFVNFGLRQLAENRVDKLLDKMSILQDLRESISWHLIGSLQTRKVKEIINQVDVFHALDSVKLAKEIDKRLEQPLNCFLQVNISGEESKHGFNPQNLPLEELAALSKLNLIGIMTMAPLDANEDQLNDIFSKAHELQEKIAAKRIPNMPMTKLSMGMSRDYEIAIKHGATHVRIGHEFIK